MGSESEFEKFVDEWGGNDSKSDHAPAKRMKKDLVMTAQSSSSSSPSSSAGVRNFKFNSNSKFDSAF